MKVAIEKVLEMIDQAGFSVSLECDTIFMIEGFTHSGGDMSAEIDSEGDAWKFIDNLRSYAFDFDVSKETYMWLDSEGHGKNGAPYGMKDVYEDIEWWPDALEELANDLEREMKKLEETL